MSEAKSRRRRTRFRLRCLRFLSLLAPTVLVVGWDFARRADRILALDRKHLLGYAATTLVSAAVWASLLYVASARRSPHARGRRRATILGTASGAFFFVLYGLATGVQAAFFSLFNVYLSLDSQIHSDSIAWSIVGTLPFSRTKVCLWFAVGFVLAGALLFGARRVVRPRRRTRLARPLLVLVACGALAYTPVSYRLLQSTPPDLVYVHGVAGVVSARYGERYEHEIPLVRAQRRTPASVPKLEAKRKRNVLMIVQESQRADASCIAYDPECERATLATNDLLPDRLPLLQMRSVASSTHVSIATLWTGLAPTETKAVYEEAPLLWDYAHAAGYDTAYWTSQNLIFANERLCMQDAPIRHWVSGTELDPFADIIAGAPDRALSDRVIAEWGELTEPFFAVVHYANIHRPRVFDAKFAPFQPTDDHERSPKDGPQRNFYRNAVYLSDVAVARLLEHVRKTEAGQRTVVFYTSDHGESYFEHHQDNDHSGSVFDEEIHVPAWVDAPEGLLDPSEIESLQSARDEYLFHVDVAPTLLDMLGVWDAPGLAPFRTKMMGHPLTRPARTHEPVPLTNVTWVWEYVVPNWGLMQGPLKVLAKGEDEEFSCFDVREDPKEENEISNDGCAFLIRAGYDTFHMLPKDLRRLKEQPTWGKGI